MKVFVFLVVMAPFLSRFYISDLKKYFSEKKIKHPYIWAYIPVQELKKKIYLNLVKCEMI